MKDSSLIRWLINKDNYRFMPRENNPGETLLWLIEHYQNPSSTILQKELNIAGSYDTSLAATFQLIITHHDLHVNFYNLLSKFPPVRSTFSRQHLLNITTPRSRMTVR